MRTTRQTGLTTTSSLSVRAPVPAAADRGVPVKLSVAGVEVLVGAPGSAVSVSVVAVPPAGFGANDACSPGGRAVDGASSISPLDPASRPIVTGTLALVPCPIVTRPPGALKVKSGCAGS